MRRPASSTLFPYTTLFRSADVPVVRPRAAQDAFADVAQRGERRPARSEEHTSELQSHVNLVCRLLLEKKNSGAAWPALAAGATPGSRRGTAEMDSSVHGGS